MKWTPEQIQRLTAYVNRPWPGYCWDFVRFFRKEFCGVDTPEVAFDPRSDLANARLIRTFEADLNFVAPIVNPDDGDVVSLGHGQYGMHVGVFASFDRGKVLHVEHGREVLCEAISRLAWSRIKFFRLKDAA